MVVMVVAHCTHAGCEQGGTSPSGHSSTPDTWNLTPGAVIIKQYSLGTLDRFCVPDLTGFGFELCEEGLCSFLRLLLNGLEFHHAGVPGLGRYNEILCVLDQVRLQLLRQGLAVRATPTRPARANCLPTTQSRPAIHSST